MLNELAKVIHEANKEKGLWDKPINVGEMLMLVTSELGEAMDAHQKGNFADRAAYISEARFDNFKENFELNIKNSFEDEIADSIIRLLDMAGGLGINIDFHVHEKIKYNKIRPRLHGKKY